MILRKRIDEALCYHVAGRIFIRSYWLNLPYSLDEMLPSYESMDVFVCITIVAIEYSICHGEKK